MAAPEFISNSLTLVEGQTISLSINDIEASADGAADSEIIFTVNSPVAGTFLLSSVEATEFTQEDLLNGLVSFRHDGFNNPPQYTVTARVGDEASDPNEPTVAFTAINDAPIFLTNALTISEGATVVLTDADISTIDEESAPEALTYEIQTLSNGELQRVDGEGTTSLAVGDTFTQAEVNAGAIQFVHDGSESQPSYRLRVTDGGIPDDPTPKGGGSRDATVDFTPINDAPQIITNTLTLQEDTTVVLTSDDLEATDVETSNADLLFTVTAVSGGRFERLDESGAVVEVVASPESAPIPFSQNEILLQRIQFVNEPGTNTPPTYTIEVSDLGDPVQTDSSAADIDFTEVNDVPVLQTLSLAIADGEQIPLTSDILSVTDEETLPENVQYQVTSVSNGRFVLLADGSTVESFTQADIDAGNIIAFEQDGSILAPTFSLTASDGENSIVVESGDGVVFQPVNDPPVIEVNTLTIAEGGSVVLSSVDNLRTTDAETSADELRYVVTITNADPDQPDGFEVAGEFFTGPEVTFTQAQVDAGLVTFVHGGSDFTPNLAVTVTDTFNPDFGDPITLPVNLEVNFTAFNDVPVVVTNTLEIGEGGTVILNSNPDALNLVTTDEESPAEALTYTINEVENGEFQRFDPLQGVVTETLMVGSTFTQADVDAGVIQFTHNGGEEAPTYTLIVADTATSPDGEPNTVPTTVTIPDGGFVNINDDPTFVTNTLTIFEGTTVTFDETNLSASDVDSSLSQLTFEISDVVGGTFFLDGEALVDGVTFTTSAISFDLLTFEDDGDEVAPSYTVTVRDPEGGALSQAASVDFIEVNDAPILVTNSFTITEGGLLTLNNPQTPGTVNLLAEDDTTPAEELVYSVSNVTGGDFFDFLANPVNSFTQAQLISGDILFEHDGSEVAPSFDITVSDGEAEVTVAGNIEEFIEVNDAPTLEANELSVSEGESIVISPANFSASDPDTAPEVLTFNISDLSGGQFNLIEGETITEGITSFTLAQVIAGQVEFVDDGDEVPPSLSVSVSDEETTTAPVVVDTSGFETENDAPIAMDDGGDGFGTDENTAFTTASVLQNDTDEENDDLTIEAFAGGSLTTALGAVVTLSASGDAFEYDPNGQFNDLATGATVVDSFQYTVSDGNGGTDTATVTVEVSGVNDAPVATDDGGVGFLTDERTALVTPSLLFNDTDEEGDDLSVIEVEGNALSPGETLVLSSGALVNLNDGGSLTYNPNGAFDNLGQNEIATDTFTYTVSDGNGGSDSGSVSIDIFGLDFLPTVFLDYEQFLRLEDPGATVPEDEIDGLPLVQLFDETYYLRENPDIAAAVDAGFFDSGYDHFVMFGLEEGRNPSVLYDEAFYLSNNSDVAMAVDAGVFSSGLEHFLLFGHEELRDPSAV
ncbi:MAG: hypothetical protein F6K42_17605, partial [Leptolyngbya sp. SIO1D8]|nr:hypothetical protein [Leptolyngbya sp. SIO1D8]